MLHVYSFPCSNHASTTTFTSPFLLNITSSHLSDKSSSFPFSRRSFNPPTLRSVLPVSNRSSLQFFDIKQSKSMCEFYEVELKVRDYEVDQYGVVNNAVYANYCQHCGEEFLKSIGINFGDVIRSGDAIAMSKLTLKFLAPLRSGDKFVVKVRISGLSAARIYFDHFIYKLPNQEPVLEAKTTVVRLDKNYRPVRISEDMKSKIFKCIGGDES